MGLRVDRVAGISPALPVRRNRPEFPSSRVLKVMQHLNFINSMGYIHAKPKTPNPKARPPPYSLRVRRVYRVQKNFET